MPLIMKIITPGRAYGPAGGSGSVVLSSVLRAAFEGDGLYPAVGYVGLCVTWCASPTVTGQA